MTTGEEVAVALVIISTAGIIVYLAVSSSPSVAVVTTNPATKTAPTTTTTTTTATNPSVPVKKTTRGPIGQRAAAAVRAAIGTASGDAAIASAVANNGGNPPYSVRTAPDGTQWIVSPAGVWTWATGTGNPPQPPALSGPSVCLGWNVNDSGPCYVTPNPGAITDGGESQHTTL